MEEQPPPQQPPPQHPPPPAGAGAAEDAPLTETVESSLTVSSWPEGQVAGSPEAVIGRETSKVSPHARQRKS